jgi:transcription initiation factor TFIID subunit 2
LYSPFSAQIFLDPVDPEALGIPMYFQVIPKQDARDITTIRKKLDHDEYASFDAFEADFRLMLNNCYIFNGETSAAGEVGKMLENEFDREFDAIKSSMPGASSTSNKGAKRGSTGPPGGGGGTIKKIRLSTG